MTKEQLLEHLETLKRELDADNDSPSVGARGVIKALIATLNDNTDTTAYRRFCNHCRAFTDNEILLKEREVMPLEPIPLYMSEP